MVAIQTLYNYYIRQSWSTVDGPNLATDQPLVGLARRRTGVKNGGGTARDVVSFLVRLRPVTPNYRGPWKGPFCRLEAEGFE